MGHRMLLTSLAIAFLLLFPAGAEAQWQQLNGPRGTGISAILNEDSVMFAGGSFQTGEFFVSRNHGASWELQNTGLPSNSENGGVATSGSLVWLITGGGYLYKANRSDLHWTKVVTGFPPNTFISRIVNFHDRLFLTTNRGIYRSSDLGTTWETVNNGIPAEWYSSLTPLDGMLFIGSTTGAIFYTQDLGNSWIEINTATLPDIPVYALTKHDSVLVAGSDNAICRSTDLGGHWSVVANVPAFYIITDFYADSALLLASAFEGGILRSNDFGATWAVSDSGLLINSVSSLEQGNGCILAATRAGVFSSTDGGHSWFIGNNGLTCTSVNDLARQGDSLFTASYLGVSRSVDGGMSWEHIMNPAPGPNGPYVNCLHSFSGYLYAGTSGTTGIFRSGNGGESWEQVNSGLTDRGIMTIGHHGTVLYAGTQDGLYRSDNFGNTWSLVFSGETIYKLACSADSIFIACYSGVYGSPDDGLRWGTCNTGLTDPWFTALYSDGSSLFGGSARFYTSALQPVAWGKKSTGMTYPASLRDITSAGGLLFAGGAHGVWVANREEQVWSLSSFGAGISWPVESLIHDDSLLYAATYRGIWRRPLAELVQLEAIPDTVRLSFGKDSTASLFISGNACWSLAGELPAWLTASPLQGNGRDTVIFLTLEKNPSEEPRSVVLHLAAPLGPEIPVTVIQQGKPAGTGEHFSGSVTLAPNPCRGMLRVVADEPVLQVRLTSADGRPAEAIHSGTLTEPFRLPPGIYLVTVVLHDRVITQKLVSLDY